MNLSYEKCKVMHVGHGNPMYSYTIYDPATGQVKPLLTTVKEKDLGVYFSSDLKFHDQVDAAASKANKMLGMLSKTFSHFDDELLNLLYFAFVRPHLEFAVSVWNPYMKMDIWRLEQVRHRATRLVPGLRRLPYEERLEVLGWTTLQDRRVRGDLIQLYKVCHGLDKVQWQRKMLVTPSINSAGPASGIRGHNLRRTRESTYLSARHNFFLNRVAPVETN